MEGNKIKRNRPVATVLKEFSERRRGKVVEARKELQKRFPYLDWPLQKDILLAHLQSNQSDRTWAYNQLYSFWDESLQEPILQVWEKHRELRCLWYIIRHFPKSYLLENQTELLESDYIEGPSDNYFYLCLRLADEKGFELQEDKLSDRNFLIVHSQLKKQLSAERIMPRFYRLISLHCRQGKLWNPVFGFFKKFDDWLSLRLLSDVYYTLRLAKSVADADALKMLDDWEQKVLREAGESEQWHVVMDSFYTDEARAKEVRKILISFVQRNLPEEYTHVIPPKADNPDVGRLLSELDLEVQEKAVWHDDFYW